MHDPESTPTPEATMPRSRADLQSTLSAIVDRYGPTLFFEPERLKLYLLQGHPDAGRDVSLLLSALAARVPQQVLAATSDSDLQAMLPRLVGTLANSAAFDRDSATWVVRAWTHALGLPTPGLDGSVVIARSDRNTAVDFAAIVTPRTDRKATESTPIATSAPAPEPAPQPVAAPIAVTPEAVPVIAHEEIVEPPVVWSEIASVSTALPEPEPIESFIEHVAPMEPVAAIEPVESIEPVAAIELVEPVEPVAAIEPVNTIDPVAVAEAVEPVEPVETLAPVEPLAPVADAFEPEAVKPIEPPPIVVAPIVAPPVIAPPPPKPTPPVPPARKTIVIPPTVPQVPPAAATATSQSAFTPPSRRALVMGLLGTTAVVLVLVIGAIAFNSKSPSSESAVTSSTATPPAASAPVAATPTVPEPAPATTPPIASASTEPAATPLPASSDPEPSAPPPSQPPLANVASATPDAPSTTTTVPAPARAGSKPAAEAQKPAPARPAPARVENPKVVGEPPRPKREETARPFECTRSSCGSVVSVREFEVDARTAGRSPRGYEVILRMDDRSIHTTVQTTRPRIGMRVRMAGTQFTPIAGASR